MTPEVFAKIYAALTVLPLAMQLAVAGGAPLGRYTVGGRFDGKLPPPWRALAVVQAGVLAGLATTVLTRAGVITLTPPAWTFWLAYALTWATFAANVASPSPPERRLWGPVTALMTLCINLVAWL